MAVSIVVELLCSIDYYFQNKKPSIAVGVSLITAISTMVLVDIFFAFCFISNYDVRVEKRSRFRN